MRKALELSTTTAPAAAATGSTARETLPGVLERTISTPRNASSEIGSIGINLAPERHRLAGASLGGQELDRGDRKGPLLQKADHPVSHGSAGPNHGDVLHDRTPRLVTRQCNQPRRLTIGFRTSLANTQVAPCELRSQQCLTLSYARRRGRPRGRDLAAIGLSAVRSLAIRF